MKRGVMVLLVMTMASSLVFAADDGLNQRLRSAESAESSAHAQVLGALEGARGDETLMKSLERWGAGEGSQDRESIADGGLEIRLKKIQ